jgi:hypothetical protein
MARTVCIETELPTDADRVWSAMQYPVTFLYLVHGLFGMPALAGRSAPVVAGESGSGWLFAFHVIPAYRHTLEVVEVDPATRTLRTHEYGGVLKRWDHTLHAEPLGDGRCRYRDTITIDAGRLTPLAAVVARGIFRYRQRRWHRLVRNHLLPARPS